ncbi:hypothetical protein Rctr197k_229 [Virus Rctr197k]|nr:hypothetical protein Rctr197k_229 [Virus Rctr197k]
MRKLKPIVEYWIVKLSTPPDPWEGSFTTEARARKTWLEAYANDADAPQDFAVARVTTEFLPATFPPARRKTARKRSR